MPVVRMPDGTQVDLPDNPSPEQLKQLDAVLNPKPGFKEGVQEVARVADKSVRKGVMGLPGFIGDSALAVMRNVDKLPWSPITGLAKLGDMLTRGQDSALDRTKFGDVTHALETAGGTLPEVSEPKTSGGKAAANVLEPMIGTMLGGGPASMTAKAVTGGMAGLGGEVAARVTDDNPLARAGGALAAGGATGVIQSINSNAENLMREATRHMTESDWRRAKVIEATLGEEGIPHLKSQLLGPRSTLADVVAVGSTNPSVRPKLVSGVENATDKARESLERTTLTNLPIPMEERKQVLRDVQEAANSALLHIRQKGNTAYRGEMPAEGEAYPPEFIDAMHEALKQLSESSKYGPTTAAGKAIMKVADGLYHPGGKLDTSGVNPTVLLRAQKAGEDLSTLPGAKIAREPVTDQHQINNLIKELNLKATTDDYKGLPLEEVKKVMKELTEPEFGAAREAKTKVMTEEYNPASQGLTGDLARMGGKLRPDRIAANDQALTIVFPKDRPQPDAIRELGKTMGGDGVGQLLREHLARSMEVAATNRGGVGANVQGPASFIESIAGTDAQRKNLEAAIKVSAETAGANPAAVRNGFYKLMRAFDSFKDLKLPDTIDRAALAQQAGKTLPGFAVAPQSRLGRAFWEKATAKTYNEIADTVLSPDGLSKLETIAKSSDPQIVRQVALSVLLSTQTGLRKAD